MSACLAAILLLAQNYPTGSTPGPTTNGGPGTRSTGGSASGGSTGPATTVFAWDDSLESAVSRACGAKYIFVYVPPAGESRHPIMFDSIEVRLAADHLEGKWIFVRLPFSSDSAVLKRLQITAAPAIAGCDPHGNAFQRGGAALPDAVRAILKGTPDRILAWHRTFMDDWGRAKTALDAGDEARAVRPLADVATCGKVGYPQVEQAFARLGELGRKRLAACVDAAALQKLAVDFKDTPPGASAEVKIAEDEARQEKFAAAIARLAKVVAIDDAHWKEAREAARRALGDVSSAGERRVSAAMELLRADPEKAKAALRRVQSEFKGTAASARAAEALKSLH